MEVIYASGVLEEVSESANYYEEEVEGLGKTFLDKVIFAGSFESKVRFLNKFSEE